MALPGVAIFVAWPYARSRVTVNRSPLDERNPPTLLPDLAWIPIQVVLLALGWWLGTLSLHAWT